MAAAKRSSYGGGGGNPIVPGGSSNGSGSGGGGGGAALPAIRSNPITGSSVSAWGKTTSFQTTSQAAQLDLFYKKPGSNLPVQGNAGIAQQQLAQAALPVSQQQYIGGSPLKGNQYSSLGATTQNAAQREEMASMYATSIASSAVQNTGKRGAEGGYCFSAEWFDTSASLVKKFYFLYFPIDTSVELYDIKNKRVYLKRCPFPGVSLKDLYVGATVAVYGRQLKLIGYGDEYTRSQLENIKARTLALIRPEAYGNAGKIIDAVTRHGLSIGQIKLCKLSAPEAAAFTGNEQAGSALAGKPVIALEVIGKDAQSVLSGAAGGDSKDSKSSGSDSALKNVIASGSSTAAAAELSFFFEQNRSCPALISSQVTVLVIRPHAVTSGYAGQIIDTVLQAGFEITALQSFHLDKTAAEEFLEVYKGVLPEYSGLVDHMASGNSIALELVSHTQDSKESAVDRLRTLCGPIDPVIGKHIRPNSLRARFGVNRVLNAVHCTDLPEDGPLESEFFFSILQKK